MTAQPADDLQAVAETEAAARPAGIRLPLARRRVLLLAALGVLLALLLYYPVGAWRAHAIDDDPGFTATAPAGQSQAAALAALLIRREIDVHGWTPNKPFFMPAAILTDMPNFQKGIIAAIGRFAIEMDEQIGRPEADGQPATDADLAAAAGLLQYPANVWMIDPRVPWATTISTEKQYRNAARALEAYNQRVANGQAAFSRRADTLAAVLARFAKDLDDAAVQLDGPVGRRGGWLAGGATADYFAVKGRAYATLLLLRALGEDDRQVLAERELLTAWQDMLGALAGAATPRPWVVLAGAPDSLVVPNHLAAQGFALLTAESRLTALADALR